MLVANWTLLFFTDWPEKFPDCAKSPQSPICPLTNERDLTRKVDFVNYDEPIGLIVENTGHGGMYTIDKLL